MSEHRKKLLENLFSLSTLKAADYLLPLLTIPYLVRILGPEKFGLIAFAQAFVEYFVVFTDYGFNFSATREISIHRNNSQELNRIFSRVLSAKILLTIFALLVFGMLVFSFPIFLNYWPLFFLSFGTVVGKAFFASWFFQGMEKMKFITGSAIIARLVFIVAVFVLVRSSADYLLVALLNSAGFILTGIIGMWFVHSFFKVRFIFPRLIEVWDEMKKGFYVFVGMIAGTLYTTSNTFILGLMTTNTIVAYYSVGEKIVKAVQSLFTPISQTVFPHISYLLKDSKALALNFIRKLALLSSLFTFISSVILFIFAPQIVKVFLGYEYIPSILVIRILAFLPFVCSLGNILGTQLMLNFGMSKIFARIITFAGIYNIIMALVLIPFLGENGVAIAVITAEFLITLSMFIVLEMNRISPRKKWIKKYGEGS